MFFNVFCDLYAAPDYRPATLLPASYIASKASSPPIPLLFKCRLSIFSRQVLTICVRGIASVSIVQA
jgi:hypothetical protein